MFWTVVLAILFITIVLPWIIAGIVWGFIGIRGLLAKKGFRTLLLFSSVLAPALVGAVMLFVDYGNLYWAILCAPFFLALAFVKEESI